MRSGGRARGGESGACRTRSTLGCSHPSLLVRAAPDGEGAAGFRQLRARLRRHGDPQVIAVAGGRACAGAPAIAANLALAFAEGSREAVALVADPRSAPSLRRLFRSIDPPATPEPGERWPDARWRSVEGAPRLDVLWPLDAGAPPPLDLLIAWLRMRYRHVVLAWESSGWLPRADALLLVGRGRGWPSAARVFDAGAARETGEPGRSKIVFDRPGAAARAREPWRALHSSLAPTALESALESALSTARGSSSPRVLGPEMAR